MMLFSKNNSSKVHALIMEQIKDVDGCLIAFENFMLAALKEDTTDEMLRALASSVHQMEKCRGPVPSQDDRFARQCVFAFLA